MRKIIATVLIALSLNVNAGIFTANEYLSWDEGSRISTVAGMFAVIDEFDPSVCYPVGVSVGQTRAMFEGFLRSPQGAEVRHKSMAALYRLFMISKFPCEPTQPNKPAM